MTICVKVMKILQITNSLTLQQIGLDDAPEMFRVIDSQREHLGRWLPFVPLQRTVDDSRAFIQSVLDGSELVFAMRYDGIYIGTVGFKETALDNSHTEIGYWMHGDYQGRGLMTASVQELVRFAMEDQGIGEVFIKCAVGNERSRNIPLRLGFTFRQIIPNDEFVSEGVFRDVEVYSLRKL